MHLQSALLQHCGHMDRLQKCEIFFQNQSAASLLLNYYGELLELFNTYQSAACKHLKHKRLPNSFKYHFEIYQKISENSNTVTGISPTIFKQCTNSL
jgi:hypothetical protein